MSQVVKRARREPVVVAAVAAFVALAAAFNVDLSGWADTAEDVLTAAFVVFSVFHARSRVSPV